MFVSLIHMLLCIETTQELINGSSNAHCLFPHWRKQEKGGAITLPQWVSLLKEFVSIRGLGGHWSITHIGMRFLFSQVSSWWFPLYLEKQCSAEGMYSLIRKVSLHSHVAHLNCFIITAWLRGIGFLCWNVALIKSKLWVLSPCGPVATWWFHPRGFTSSSFQRHNIWHK